MVTNVAASHRFSLKQNCEIVPEMSNVKWKNSDSKGCIFYYRGI